MKHFIASVKTVFKNVFFILRLHVLMKPFKKYFLKTYYLIVQSEWIHRNKKKAGLNDFFTSKYEVKRMYDLFSWINKNIIGDETVDYFEFGVYKGNSINWWLNSRKNVNDNFYGFDTFEGLPEDFGSIKKGGYSANNIIPETNNSKCKFIKGLFQETLFPFLKDYENKNRKVIHIDCDLYSSTLYVLTTIGHYLRPGDIIIFDEFVTPSQEFKAFHDFSTTFYMEFELLCAVNNFHQTAVIVKTVCSGTTA